jgi:hypothetical protein|tara:strand:+ start:2249 stop:2851 length:603 start_codon:yes stop_codon:yes gene_type:complete
MANNFVNSFASIVTAGEFYQSDASDTSTGPQTVYTANNGSSGVNSILIELDAANTGTSGITVSALIQDTSSTLGSITSIVSSSDVATVTTGSAHGLKVGMYVNVTGSSTNYVNGVYKVASVPSTTTFTYAQNSGAADGTAAGTKVIYKAHHIVKDAPIPSSATLKVVAGQKVVLNSNDKVLAYASAGTCDIVAGILQEVT